MDINTMRRNYYIREYCHGSYIIGIHADGRIYVYIVHGFNLAALAVIDHCSSSKGKRAACLKYRQSNTRTAAIKASAVDSFELCTVDELKAAALIASPGRANLGLGLEKLVYEHYGLKWEHDHVAWWEGPDIVINGQPYQIKYDKAQLCHEGQAGLE